MFNVYFQLHNINIKNNNNKQTVYIIHRCCLQAFFHLVNFTYVKYETKNEDGRLC